MKTNPQSLLSRRWSVVLVMLLGLGLAGCEAPLDLSLVEREINKPVHRFDQLKAAAVNHKRIVVVGDYGTVLTTTDKGESWQRTRLPTRASLLAVAACGDGRFIAIDTVRNAWVSDTEGGDWQQRPLGTQESPMAVACDPRGRFWVTASFSTLIASSDGGETWQEQSQQEDMLFTHIQWLDADTAVVAGEFGSIFFTSDGGESWERGNDIPNEFYPMAAHFNSLEEGWVAGLSGTILHTTDGGENWRRQPADSKAPIYSLIPHAERLYATGDSGTLLQLEADQWRRVPEAPRMFSYLITAIPVGEEKLLVTGGRGNLSPIVIAESGETP